MLSVLFVCTANICRSPMAEGLFKQKLAQKSELSNWTVESAGTWAQGGLPAADKGVYLLQQMGINIRDHQSRCVKKPMIESFNLILTMEQGQKEALQIEFPECEDRIFLLSEMVGTVQEIEDPIGGELQDYKATIKEIDQILTDGYEKISQLADRKTNLEAI